MKLSEKELLNRLGAGESIAAVCEAAGLSRDEFDAWWTECAAARVPDCEGTCQAAVQGTVEIRRDERGIPHIYADNDGDLFFGLGFSMAQDRLFQLDYLRRKARGRLSEVLGPDGLQPDTIARTVGLNRIAEAEWGRLGEETQRLLTAFSAGVNAVIDANGDGDGDAAGAARPPVAVCRSSSICWIIGPSRGRRSIAWRSKASSAGT